MYKSFFKRFFDIILSSLAIILLSPLLSIVAFGIRIKLGSPILFSQPRPGKDEKIFYTYKFRTMTNETDEDGKLLPDIKRLTKFGKIIRKFSLDELPQFYNVLKGEMSLIGPRPLLIEYLDYYTERERHRHDVRPGITGWAQVHGRNGLNFDTRFELDVWYVENLTFKLDLIIIYKTFLGIFTGKDVTIPKDIKLKDKRQKLVNND